MEDLLERTHVSSTKGKVKVKRPPKYSVFVFDNDRTPLDTVIICLVKVFGLTPQKSMEIAMAAQMNGKAVVVTTTYEVAEMFYEDAVDYSNKNDSGRLKFELKEEAE